MKQLSVYAVSSTELLDHFDVSASFAKNVGHYEILRREASDIIKKQGGKKTRFVFDRKYYRLKAYYKCGKQYKHFTVALTADSDPRYAVVLKRMPQC